MIGDGLEHARRQQRRQADATKPDHGDAASSRHRRRVDDGADAGNHGAAEQAPLRRTAASGSTRTSDRRDSVAYSAKPDTPR